MAIKPILFNTEMVRAIQNDRKTVTRRVIKPQPDCVRGIKHPYQVGDILWVREMWSTMGEWTGVDPSVGACDEYLYKAGWINVDHPRWHASIHMPREAARIFLRVTNVWVERIQDITDDGVSKEGFLPITDCSLTYWVYCPEYEEMQPCYEADPCINCPVKLDSREIFRKMVWDKTIKPHDLPIYGWDANPWVWVIEFERCEKPENF